MKMLAIFGVSEEDIVAVLRKNAARVQGLNGRSFLDYAEVLYGRLTNVELNRIAKAAPNGDADGHAQTTAAHKELQVILTEFGVLA
ncbi:TPA: hypothetical protein QDB04_000098 [Burkholderia vietnamiensis]|nr:hypothetical protein [Burkholderia vietnamiensis]